MAEVILFNFAEKILSKLGSYALQQIRTAWGVKEELEKLKNTISTVRSILLDAQKQQVTNDAVKGWLERLKDVVYEVDDLVDEVATEALQKQVETHGSRTREVLNFLTYPIPFKFRSGVGSKIKRIRKRLDEVVADMRDFEFAVRIIDRPEQMRGREETYSFVRSSEVIGRGRDREHIMQLLMHSYDEENVAIIPIVGMGGLGKTTLAQFVYNDIRMAAKFNKRLWVCVSNDSDIKKVMEKIVKATGDTDSDNLGIEPLQNRLREILSDGKYLLVLDDVWSEDRVEWIKLRDLLTVGARGSRIIVTTRSKTVASIMGTTPSYDLKGLSDDDCLSILVKWAFNERDEREHPNLVNIGRDIVKKCGGVPLAARTLGGLLYLKTDERDWLSVRNNEIWTFVQMENDILPALRLSYDQMPSYLKQCFAYCSLFVKDQEIYKWELIYRWMAQGFIQSTNLSEELEDTGERYLNELVRRSFLLCRSSPKRSFLEFREETYKMHDLVHDLAQLVAGSECFTMNSNTELLPGSVRHALMGFRLSWEFPRALLEVKKLRSLFLQRGGGVTAREGLTTVDTLISGFGCLRVLDLGSLRFDMPISIGNLKHLRYLRIGKNYSMETLPDSFGRLLNLQYLHLNCPRLQELPKGFGKLINLRYFYLSTYLYLLSSRLTCLPEKEISGLISLRTLCIWGCTELTSLSEGIRDLTCLRNLCLDGCTKLAALPSSMRYLTALEQLDINYCPILNFSEDDLQGLRSLKSLSLCSLPRLISLPMGLQESADTLSHIRIDVCLKLRTLSESFQNFISLQRLEIHCCPNLLSLPEGMRHLAALRSLEIYQCPLLGARCQIEHGDDWPKIAHVPKIIIDFEIIKQRAH